MWYSAIDLLGCPVCKGPLTVTVAKEAERTTTMRVRAAERTSRAGVATGPLPDPLPDTPLAAMLEAHGTAPATDGRDRRVAIDEAVLLCLGCERWYPVRDGLPELLPEHLRTEDDREWLQAKESEFQQGGLGGVWRFLQQRKAFGTAAADGGVGFKRAEMAVGRRSLPDGFFGPALAAPFNQTRPSFTLDLLARFVTTVSRLGCGIGGVVLDLGAGYAWTTEWLVRLGYVGIGVDICRSYLLAGLPRMGANSPHLVVADVENLPLRPSSLDAVLSFDAFHHVPDRERSMAELSRAMRSGSRMVLVEPGAEHEHHPQSIAVMEQHGILEKGFDEAALQGYIRDTDLGAVEHHGSDTHPHDVYVVHMAGAFSTDSRSPRVLLAEIAMAHSEGLVGVGEPVDVTVTVTNAGDTLWLPSTPDGVGEVHLGAHLFSPARDLLFEDYARVVLPRPVSAGETVVLRCQLPPILQPGRFRVEFDMVDNGLLWFKDYAYQPREWLLEVRGVAAPDRASQGLVRGGRSQRVPSREVGAGSSDELGS